MKLAIFHMLPSGGGCRAVSRFLEGLAGRFDVTLHVPQGAFGIRLPGSVSQVDYPFRGSRRLSGIRRLLAPLTLPLRLAGFDRVCRQAADAINSSADVVLVHNTLVVAAPPLLQYLEIPSAYFCFEYPRHIYEPDLVMRTGSRATEILLAPLISMERRVDRASVGSASIVLALSTYMQEQIERIYGIRPVVIRPGVDTEFYCPGMASQEPLPGNGFLLSVGALWPFKGHDLAIESIALLEEGARPGLTVVADREYPGHAASLARLASRRGVDLTIRIGVSDTELRGLYRGARAVLCCQHREPYGLVPLEAMACGCPVVAVDEGGFTDNITRGETGILVQRDPWQVSEAVDAVLHDSVVRDALSTRGRRFVEEERASGAGTDRLGDILEHLT